MSAGGAYPWPAQFEPWSTRPWDRCSARTPEVHPAGDVVRCDLRKRHRTPYHRAERGMYHVVWTVDAGTVLPSVSVVLCAIPGHHGHDYRDCPDLTTGREQSPLHDRCLVCDRDFPQSYDECPSRNQPWHKRRAEGREQA